MRCTIPFFIYRVTQKVSDVLWVTFRNVLKDIFNCVPWFLTFSSNIEKCLCILFVRPSVNSLTVINVLQKSLILYVLLIFDIQRTVLKVTSMGLRVSPQRYKKVFQCISAYEGTFLKIIVTYLYCTKCNVINKLHLFV